ncbi:MAG: Riboflavin biosynthesis protein RibD [Methanobacteriota archaeon]|nr:MAG: Riboflavin biosynthesis protein RibD [Euryarchaeota archaeon]
MIDAAPPDNMEPDVRFMARAIEIAERGLARVSPNPPVGCVLVRDGRIIAEGWHDHIGNLHAEQAAIADAEERGEPTEGATAYVTLEPCNHFGRTPPCTQALLWAGIDSVIIAAKDPNPNVRGHGIRVLEEAGIEVRYGMLKLEAEMQMQAFMRWCHHRRPIVTLKMAVDAKNRVDTDAGPPARFTTEKSLHFAHALRRQTDAILVGSGTVIRDNPSLTIRHVPLDGVDQPLRIVLDRRGRVSSDAKVWNQEAASLHIHGLEGMEETMNGESIAIADLNEEKGLHDLLDLLGDRGIQELLIEGGPQIWTSFLDAGLVDRLIHIRSHQEIGNGPVMILNEAYLESNELLLHSESEDTGDCIQIYTKSNFKPPNSAWPYPSG